MELSIQYDVNYNSLLAALNEKKYQDVVINYKYYGMNDWMIEWVWS